LISVQSLSHFVNNSSSLRSIDLLMTAFNTSHNLHKQQPGQSSLKRRDLHFSRFISMLFPITSFQYYSHHFISILFPVTSFQYYSLSLHFNIIPHHFISISFSITSFQYYSPSLHFSIIHRHFISILFPITSF